ncbi:hypothetical protein KUV62_04885 [Salipiger bermudensis]|nr:hypothetical protein [Salipiger bermudensis]MBY6003232.1 hypothetical protein [Salipiger bermudensis]
MSIRTELWGVCGLVVALVALLMHPDGEAERKALEWAASSAFSAENFALQ